MTVKENLGRRVQVEVKHKVQTANRLYECRIELNAVMNTVVFLGYSLPQYSKVTKDHDYKKRSIYLFHC
jgi:phage baseplate assembly protein W